MSMIMIIPVYAQEEGTLYLQPETVSLEGLAVGDTFIVEARITDVTDCFSIAFSLEWNVSILEMVGTPTQGDVLEGAGITTFFMGGTLNSTGGYLKECAYTRLGQTLPGVNVTSPDTGLVATITFKVLQAPEAGPIDTNIEIVVSAPWSQNPTYWKDSPASGNNVHDFAEINPCHVIPEFPAVMYLTLFMVAALLAALITKKMWSTKRRGQVISKQRSSPSTMSELS